MQCLGVSEAAMMGESALIDKETGRVFWEGGASSTLVESIIGANLDKFGAEHAQSALLTIFISVAFLGILAGWLRQIIEIPVDGYEETSTRLARFSYFLLSKTLFQMPRLKNKWLMTATVALYFLESYNCDTRRFLANALSSPTGVEEFIEMLRSEQPVVTWVVRSFHYRKRKLFTLGEILQSTLRKLNSRDETDNVPATPSSKKCSPAFPFTRKVVTNEASAIYQYQTCQDNTIAGLWRRSDAVENQSAPFTRIVLNKMLVLKDRKTRADYFSQQSAFVTENGRGDEFTEFYTDIHVPGYRPRMLAVRAIPGISSAKLFRLHLFWFFTLCGLSLPYRIWFKRHCDSLRVTLVKETSATPSSSSSYWGYASRWMPSRASIVPHVRNSSDFRNYMKARLLYGREEVESEVPVHVETPPQESGAESLPSSQDTSSTSNIEFQEPSQELAPPPPSNSQNN